MSLLDVDSELAEAVPDSERHAARRGATALVLETEGTRWDLNVIADRDTTGVLFFVLDGLLVRHVNVAGRSAGELMGAGDVLCATNARHDYAPLPITVEWHRLAPTRLAVLDDDFVKRVARWPEVWSKLLHRSAQRASHEAAVVAVISLPRIDERLLLTFWLLAGRWGRVRADGVLVTLPLTHKLLALLVGAHRPTVSTALKRMADEGLLVRQSPDRWLLTNDALEQIRKPRRLARVADRLGGPE